MNSRTITDINNLIAGMNRDNGKRRIILITYVLRGSQSRNPGDDNVENKHGQTQTTQKIKNTQNDCHGPIKNRVRPGVPAE